MTLIILPKIFLLLLNGRLIIHVSLGCCKEYNEKMFVMFLVLSIISLLFLLLFSFNFKMSWQSINVPALSWMLPLFAIISVNHHCNLIEIYFIFRLQLRCRQVSTLPVVTQLANGRVKIAGVGKLLCNVGQTWGRAQHRANGQCRDRMSSQVTDVTQQFHGDFRKEITATIAHHILAGLEIHPRLVQLWISKCVNVNCVWVRESDLRENEAGCENR